MRFPLRVIAYRGSPDGKICSYIVKDAHGRQININCEIEPLRREVAQLWTPEEAEALAKKIARWLTDQHEVEEATRLRQQEMRDPTSWAYRNRSG